jgi:protein-disulfide isomerase
MSLKPSLSFQRIGSPSASHELSVFVDFQCSRCRILAEALDAHVLPRE